MATKGSIMGRVTEAQARSLAAVQALARVLGMHSREDLSLDKIPTHKQADYQGAVQAEWMADVLEILDDKAQALKDEVEALKPPEGVTLGWQEVLDYIYTLEESEAHLKALLAKHGIPLEGDDAEDGQPQDQSGVEDLFSSPEEMAQAQTGHPPFLPEEGSTFPQPLGEATVAPEVTDTPASSEGTEDQVQQPAAPEVVTEVAPATKSTSKKK